ncbi:hypothetical protein F8388_005994 [Cannabis sativa]|uniref:protein-serine/threonine phosphatase n=1 Tax=Cannabis sativa TaxID=3483 RepID=A0A7J6IBW2_CANSA|nr:hypothetical protein F8388_005994 [Cannabis sativa]KAF4404746.1 hypothetical protein G4B88_006132 [Cannabis sativa]
MVDFGSKSVEWIKIKEIEGFLSEMGKIEDVEEGEISDSASVEEISEEDFKKQEAGGDGGGAAAVPVDLNLKESKTKGGGGGESARGWTMRDLFQYQGYKGFNNTGLYNLAWAQAVQNKSLDDIFVMDVDSDQNSKLSSSTPAEKNNVKEVDKVVIDDSDDDMEKEEGELEEGEIDLEESNPAQESKDGAVLNCDATQINELVTIDSMHNELEKRINLIQEDLESVNVTNTEKSFEQACSRLHNTLESLREVLSKYSAPAKDVIIDISFTAIQIVNSVFCSMDQNKKDHNKDTLSRLLCFVKNSDPPVVSPKWMKEIELMAASDKLKEREIVNGVQEIDFKNTSDNTKNAIYGLTTSELPSDVNCKTVSSDVTSVAHANPITSLEMRSGGVSAFKSRGLLVPLLDLHKDHDEDSLPSPTREAPTTFSVLKSLGVGDVVVKPGPATSKMTTGTDDSRIRRYETDAVKAVSTYQQKFGGSSFLMSDRLPSPTPSEDGNEENDDTNMEVTSSVSGSSLRNTSMPMLRPSEVSSYTAVSSSSMQGPIVAKNALSASSASSSSMKAFAKSRDPRLRFANSDSGALDLNQRPVAAVRNAPKVEYVEPTSSRKQKVADEAHLDGSSFKRQRNSFKNAGTVGDVKSVSGLGGWIEDNGFIGPQFANKSQSTEGAEVDPRKSYMGNDHATNGPNMAKELVPVTSTSTTTSLPDLLKDIVVNPTMLLNIIKLGQQQQQQQQQLLVSETQLKPDHVQNNIHSSSPNSILGVAPLVNLASSKTGILQTPAASLSVTSQVAPMSPHEDLGKIRMKPRDPRRVLHGISLQKNGSLGNEQLKTTIPSVSNNPGNKDNSNSQMQEGRADQKAVSSQSAERPDIAGQFTKNLRNIADLLSVSNASTSPVIVSQSLTSQPVSVKPEKRDVKDVSTKSEDQGSGISTSETTAVAAPSRATLEAAAVAGSSRAPNTWGDVEHLFEGYDDKQKAAIQRERTRRLDEQKKMFEARKLCLVLDLDHTLLNSAKFVEVDPVHEEILRKKEEQDREKPYRHLFRFPHMGMWTKLRPGVWNFLEKASKLYEMHLYTMGNKLYATEMAKVLDPKGLLFAGRVISRGDDGEFIDGDERVPRSKDLEGVLGMESSVVIIDDSVRVWPHNKLNLIAVERYTFFPCSRRQFGLPGPSLLEIDHDERPEDGTLASSLGVIERIHQNFFSHHSLDEADVRNILASEQRKILSGCRIVFSRVFPVSEVNPHLHPLWQTAEQFGAVCTTQIDDQVTHVVANSPGTDKVNWAISNGRFAVHPGWVEASALLYRRANEQDFAIKPSPT